MDSASEGAYDDDRFSSFLQCTRSWGFLIGNRTIASHRHTHHSRWGGFLSLFYGRFLSLAVISLSVPHTDFKPLFLSPNPFLLSFILPVLLSSQRLSNISRSPPNNLSVTFARSSFIFMHAPVHSRFDGDEKCVFFLEACDLYDIHSIGHDGQVEEEINK